MEDYFLSYATKGGGFGNGNRTTVGRRPFKIALDRLYRGGVANPFNKGIERGRTEHKRDTDVWNDGM